MSGNQHEAVPQGKGPGAEGDRQGCALTKQGTVPQHPNSTTVGTVAGFTASSREQDKSDIQKVQLGTAGDSSTHAWSLSWRQGYLQPKSRVHMQNPASKPLQEGTGRHKTAPRHSWRSVLSLTGVLGARRVHEKVSQGRVLPQALLYPSANSTVLVLLEDTTGVRYSNPAEFQQDLSI